MPTSELLADLRHRIGDFLEYRAIRRHRSRLGRMDAPRYTHYLEECRRHYTGDVSGTPDVAAAVAEFERKNVASFWTAENHRLAGAIMAKLEAQERSGQKPWNERGQYAGDVYTPATSTRRFRSSNRCFADRSVGFSPHRSARRSRSITA
jgi:hypothetical protein